MSDKTPKRLTPEEANEFCVWLQDEVVEKDKRIQELEAAITGLHTALSASNTENQELKTALLELTRPLKNAYEHIQHKDYNDALSSILEAQAIAEK